MPSRAPLYGGDGRLSMIAEDADYQPAPKASPSTFSADQASNNGAWKKLRPGSASHSSKGSGSLPRHSADTAPPGYTLWDVTGPKGEKFLDVRNNRHIAKRGGWKRLLIIGAILLALAIGLGVGLGVGLPRRNSSSQGDGDSAVPSPSDQPAESGPFPQGSYLLAANLANISTDCTSVSSTFVCYPYNTFSSSAGLSGVAFNWIIANASGDATNLTISSSANPFALSFANASLTLRDQGQITEHYFFSIPLDKYVQPNPPLDSDGSLDGCWFRKTTLQAALYTRKKADANANSGQQAATTGWTAWPGAIEVNQTIAGGQGVPTCNRVNADGSQGPSVTTGLMQQPGSKQCGCFWRDFNL